MSDMVEKTSMSDIKNRFDKHYSKGSHSECWEWKSSKSASGYGRFMLNGKSRIASRVAFELSNGLIPNGLCVMHTCDNRACVNPSHLLLGTHSDNMADRNSKGRASGGSLRGESSPRAKLSREKSEAIRILAVKASISQRNIALMFGISQSVVSEIKNEKAW